MATGDIVNVTIKDGAGIDRQMPFEEQADGSLAPVHYARGPEGGAILARLSGSTISIGGTTFGLSSGDTIRGPSASRPTAADAHAALEYAFYYAVDTGVLSATDGTTWTVQ